MLQHTLYILDILLYNCSNKVAPLQIHRNSTTHQSVCVSRVSVWIQGWLLMVAGVLQWTLARPLQSCICHSKKLKLLLWTIFSSCVVTQSNPAAFPPSQVVHIKFSTPGFSVKVVLVCGNHGCQQSLILVSSLQWISLFWAINTFNIVYITFLILILANNATFQLYINPKGCTEWWLSVVFHYKQQ